MRTLPRVLLLLFVLCGLAVVVIITKCGTGSQRQRHLVSDTPEKEYYMDLLRSGQEEHQREMSLLKHKILSLESDLHAAKYLLNQTRKAAVLTDQVAYKAKALFYEKFFQQQLRDSEITTGIPLHNEYEVIPYCRFTLTRIYLVDQGMGKRVVEKPIGFKKKDLYEVISYAAEKLNLGGGLGGRVYSIEEFVEGIYRTEPSMGTHYELYFKRLETDASHLYHKVVLSRPYGPLHMVTSEDHFTNKQVINIILPLSGRNDKFTRFMDRFAKVCIKSDKHVFLTVVYFGNEGLNNVKNILGHISKTYRFKNLKLVTLNESFSRGRGLQVGAHSWTQGDVLMFLCDVDIVFNLEFLQRCRMNAAPGQRVYYPMVFSLYNPDVVYALHNLDVPSQEEQLIISKDTGFWRDFGFGMTCQYRSDFMSLKGFDEQIVGWGMEDVLLYRKYVKSDLMVLRATDPGIFHLWHEKHCDPNIPWDQYRGCIRSKALNEASHAQLGMLAFKEEVDAHKNLKKHS